MNAGLLVLTLLALLLLIAPGWVGYFCLGPFLRSILWCENDPKETRRPPRR